MLIARNAFKEENLLLVKERSGRIRWVQSDQVLPGCPSFVRYTISVADYRSVYYARLYELLGLRTWDSMHHLQTELENGIKDMKLVEPEDQATVSSYIFQALGSIANHTCNSLAQETCPSWVRSILRLSIFPVRTSSGQLTLQSLGPDIFVPDSEVLNESFQGKVKLLDFGGNCLLDVLPVLRCSDAGLKYLSDYTDPTTMEVKILEPVSDDTYTMREIWTRRLALTR